MENEKKCTICGHLVINSLKGCGCLICKTCCLPTDCCDTTCKLCKYGIIPIYNCTGCLTYHGDPKEYCEDHACEWCKLCDQCCVDTECVWNKAFKFFKNDWPTERLQKCLDECEEDFDDKLQIEIANSKKV